ncbi:MAG: hypothetical protein KJ597_03820 [Nanoarchaeota archaeon]|nr:hypothetical protein [Nanoarchaeota archaeon]MBU1622674.1 hypothetical protein [Nanoarchaeota archaeon]
MKQNKNAWSREEEEQLVRLFNAKKSITSIADTLDRSAKSVESKVWAFKLKGVLSK